jgi:hypothetical protein
MYMYTHSHKYYANIFTHTLTHLHSYKNMYMNNMYMYKYMHMHIFTYAYMHIHMHTHTVTHTRGRKQVSGRARNTRGRASCCISPKHWSQPTILLVETVPDASWKALPAKVKCSKNAQQDAVCGIESSHGVSARLPSPWQQASHSR